MGVVAELPNCEMKILCSISRKSHLHILFFGKSKTLRISLDIRDTLTSLKKNPLEFHWAEDEEIKKKHLD